MQTLEHQFTADTLNLKIKIQFTEAAEHKNKQAIKSGGNEFLFPESMGHYVKLYPDVYTALLTHKLYQTEKSKQCCLEDKR